MVLRSTCIQRLGKQTSHALSIRQRHALVMWWGCINAHVHSVATITLVNIPHQLPAHACLGTKSNGNFNCGQELDTCLRMQCSARQCVETVGLKPLQQANQFLRLIHQFMIFAYARNGANLDLMSCSTV